MRSPVWTALTTGLLAVTDRPLCLISWNSLLRAVSSAATMLTCWPISVTSPWRAITLLPTTFSPLPALISTLPSTLPTVLAVWKTFLPSTQSVCWRVPKLKPPSAPKPDFLTIL